MSDMFSLPNKKDASSQISTNSVFGGKTKILEQVVNIDTQKITEWHTTEHPFIPHEGHLFTELVESIRRDGVKVPCTVRPDGIGTYEMVSGHNRLRAAKEAGLSSIPCIIRNYASDAEATIDMIEQNIGQREKKRPSEYAHYLQQLYDAIAQRNEDQRKQHQTEGAGNETVINSRRELAAESKMSEAKVQRYLRLNHLLPGLLDAVDEGKILNVKTGGIISYMEKRVQEFVLEYILDGGFIKADHLEELRRYPHPEKLDQETAELILSGEKKPAKKKKETVISSKILKEYFPKNYSKSDMEKVIIHFCSGFRSAFGDDMSADDAMAALTVYFDKRRNNIVVQNPAPDQSAVQINTKDQKR